MDPAKAVALALDSSTSEEQLVALSQMGLTFLMEYVARHPNVTPDLLESLTPSSISSEADLRAATAVAGSEKAPGLPLLRLLALVLREALDGSRRENWHYEGLAAMILAHPNCPTEEAVATLHAAKLSKNLRLAVSQAATDRRVLSTPAHDSSPEVREAVAAKLFR